MYCVMKKVLKIIFWIIALILFPITAGLYFIWPSRIFRDKMSNGWKIFWWVTYALTAFYSVIFKVLSCTIFILLAIEDAEGSSVSRDNVTASDYRTSEDFYKLTGVEFPELEMVDSLRFCDGTFPPDFYNEYTFVAKDGLSDRFYKRLERACLTDSTHWKQTIGEPMVYHYEIYPDQKPVDRSREMCDRMEETFNGEMEPACDGDYIIVEIMNDTIILKDGWNDLTID